MHNKFIILDHSVYKFKRRENKSITRYQKRKDYRKVQMCENYWRKASKDHQFYGKIHTIID